MGDVLHMKLHMVMFYYLGEPTTPCRTDICQCAGGRSFGTPCIGQLGQEQAATNVATRAKPDGVSTQGTLFVKHGNGATL